MARPKQKVNVRLRTGRVTGYETPQGFPRWVVNNAGDVISVPWDEAERLIAVHSAEAIETASLSPIRNAAKRIGKPSKEKG